MRAPLIDYFKTALEKLGPQHWWPGETPFEVCVGAILTQNTNWGNVEKAINNLKSASVLEPRKLYGLPPLRLAELIRPAGYFNIKTKRLRSFLKFLLEEYEGDLDRMFQENTETLREKLLSVKGIGPETCDSILLYAGQKPVFVVDAYTKRIFVRHQLLSEEDDYFSIQEYFADHLSGYGGAPLGAPLNGVQQAGPLQLFNEFHALIVNIGKNWCKSREPDCENCPWKTFLPL
ncbi:MAG: endonuclease III domain-containing protein [Deltaproteobacteria bacterium]|nr:endonuclease III domain-containing protein [Deltaproteobacteria bacterium]